MSLEYETDFDQEESGDVHGSGSRRALGILIVVLGVAVAVVLGAQWLQSLAQDVISEEPATVEAGSGDPVAFTVPAGASARLIASLLEDEGVISDANAFESAVRTQGVAANLAAGDYDLTTGMSLETVIAVLIEGPAPVEGYRLIVREGLRYAEVLGELARQTPYEVADFETALISGAVTSAYLPAGASDLQSWEGLLFPDTYEFAEDATAGEILQRMSTTMQSRIEAIDWSVADALGFSRYDGIIMASIIEGETRVDGDRPQVASVIVNRLDVGMPLQIDATILYALDARGIGLTLEDLKVESPYNSYTNLGLPPTPIGAPGRASLEAAASPPVTDFIYYVLTSADGSHSFTADYNEFLGWKDKAKSEGLFP